MAQDVVIYLCNQEGYPSKWKGLIAVLEVNYFECEVCGQRFDDGWECKFHELAHITDSFLPENLMMWNCEGERIAVEDLVANYRVLSDIFAVETDNENAREYLRQMFDECGEHSPYDQNMYPHEDGLIFWDEEINGWVSYGDKLTAVMNIRKKFV